jgi:hypothetical protein
MRTSVLSALIGAGCLLLANVDPAAAQATRTWVSGVGDDVNPCSRTAPCKTFAGAISKTAANGEINCIDPGGFGAVTITKSITIDCGGTFGAILAPSGNGINVNAANIVVAIRNLTINGALTGAVGINFTTGISLHVENVNILGFSGGSATGIRFAPTTANSFLHVLNTTITTNGIAPSTGGGIAIQPAGGSALVVINDTKIENGAVGLAAASATGAITMTVRDSIIASNRSFGIIAASGNPINLMLERTTISNNADTGILANGANTTVRIYNSVITGNATGVSATGGAALRSYKNNAINGNTTTDGTPITQENLN